MMFPHPVASRPWIPLAVVLAIASLYFGKDVLVPLALEAITRITFAQGLEHLGELEKPLGP
jgi:hypothetical protein